MIAKYIPRNKKEPTQKTFKIVILKKNFLNFY